MSADYGCRRLFFMGEWGRWGGKMGLWIFLSWNRIFDWKYFPKSVNFTFSLPFYTVKTVMKRSFAWKYDGSARKQLKIPCQVSTLAVQLEQFPCRVWALGTTWHGNCFPRNGVMVPLPQSIGLERVVEIPILLTNKGTFPLVSFRGNNIRLPLASISVATQMKGP